jgi:hypothetical protein
LQGLIILAPGAENETDPLTDVLQTSVLGTLEIGFSETRANSRLWLPLEGVSGTPDNGWGTQGASLCKTIAPSPHSRAALQLSGCVVVSSVISSELSLDLLDLLLNAFLLCLYVFSNGLKHAQVVVLSHNRSRMICCDEQAAVAVDDVDSSR